jgi:hypothetical protein
MILAATKLEELEAPMLQVFQNIGGGIASKHIREISTFVKAYQTVTIDGLYRACYMTMSGEVRRGTARRKKPEY